MDPWDMNWDAPTTAAPAPTAAPTAPASSANPWEMDWGGQETAPPPPHKFGLMDTWPVRLVRGIYEAAKSGVTLPHDVWTGQVDPLSQEGIQRAADLAQTVTMAGAPLNPAIRAGDLAIPGAARRAPAIAAEGPANVRAAQTSVDLGAGLPQGLASPSAVVRGTTQAAAQLPFVGPTIRAGVEKTVERAGERVGDIASELSQGVEGRAATGAILRPALHAAVEHNDGLIDAEYNGLRNMIDPNKEFDLPNTGAVLTDVLRRRYAARKVNPTAGLEDVRNLAGGPVSFDGLQRARSDFGRKTNFGENPGYTEGERKQLYAAMTDDMEHNARQQGGEAAVNQLRAANARASDLIEQNKTLARLRDMRSEEGIAGTMINAANAKTGNVGLLAKLRSTMDPEDFQQISGAALGELGHNPATGEFSLAKFMTGWNNMSQQAKNVLFEPNHQKILDDIANLGKWIKGGEQFKGHSNTGHAVGFFAALEHVGEALGQAFTGNFKPLIGSGAGLAGGYTIGKLLARPSTASSIARWTRAAQIYDRAPTIRNRVTTELATKGVLDNLSSAGIPIGQLSRALGQALGPQQAEPNGNQPPPQGGSGQGINQRLLIRIPE